MCREVHPLRGGADGASPRMEDGSRIQACGNHAGCGVRRDFYRYRIRFEKSKKGGQHHEEENVNMRKVFQRGRQGGRQGRRQRQDGIGIHPRQAGLSRSGHSNTGRAAEVLQVGRSHGQTIHGGRFGEGIKTSSCPNY